MRHREAAQARLRERFRQLYKSDYQSFGVNTLYFLQWCGSMPVVAGLLDALRRAEQDFDPSAWYKSSVSRNSVVWPMTEVRRGKAVLWMMEQIASDPENAVNIAHNFSQDYNVNATLRNFNDVVVEPFIDYLDERLAAETDLLYLLERYKFRVQWFEHQRLWDKYNADTVRGEQGLDEDLRRFLFEQGVDYPFSQIATPAGRIDVAVLDDSDRPLPIEVKLFDGKSYGSSYLRKGVGQALRYAEDLGQPDSYLVIFNLTDRALELPSDDPGAGWPPRLHVQNQIVYMIVVPTAPRSSASTAGHPSPFTVSRDDLVG